MKQPLECCNGHVHVTPSHSPIDPFRAEFTKAILQGLISNAKWIDLKSQLALEECNNNINTAAEYLKHELVEDAIEIADAAIEELKKRVKQPQQPQQIYEHEQPTVAYEAFRF